MRNGTSSAKPETRSGEMDYPGIGGAVECIHVEIEPAHCEYAAVAGDRVEHRSAAGACDTEYDVAAAGIDESGPIVLRHQRHGAVIGQSNPVHPKRIRPRECDCASVSVKDVQASNSELQNR